MADLVNTAASIETRDDFGTDDEAKVKFWLTQLELAEKADKSWVDEARRIVKRYRDERDTSGGSRNAKYNILWSNVETLKPVLYGRTPKPDVARRNKDNAQGAVERLGADIIQRALEWEDDIEEFDDVMNAVVEDRLLPGRGVARIAYEYELGDEEEDPDQPDAGSGAGAADEEGEGEEGEEDEEGKPQKSTFQPVINERASVQYIFWEDYRETPARTEKEVWWKAYRSYMTRDELVRRFGDWAEDVDLDYTPSGLGTDQEDGPANDSFKKAQVWEIWDDKQKKAIWIAPSHKDRLLDEEDDPLELPGFFPSPRCLRATTTNDRLVPVPDYVEYLDQAAELDALTTRIDKLQRALKVAGVYAGTEKATLARLVDDSSENRLIPVEDWAGFAGDKGGLQNLIQWLPVNQIADVLIQLYDARERVLRIIYQVTGIADILRGETNPIETLGAQQLKTQFATRRITKAQKDVARFARDLLRLRGCVMARHFMPDTLARMSGLPETMPPLPPPPPMLIPAPQPAPAPAAPPAGMPGPGGPGPVPAAAPPPGGGPGAMPGGRLPPPVAISPPGPPGGAEAARPPIPGARLAPDGRHYVADPRRPGKYLMVA